jgi:hypothetical protein
LEETRTVPRKTYSQLDKEHLLFQIDHLVSKGYTKTDALTQIGISSTAEWSWRKALKPSSSTHKPFKVIEIVTTPQKSVTSIHHIAVEGLSNQAIAEILFHLNQLNRQATP